MTVRHDYSFTEFELPMAGLIITCRHDAARATMMTRDSLLRAFVYLLCTCTVPHAQIPPKLYQATRQPQTAGVFECRSVTVRATTSDVFT